MSDARDVLLVWRRQTYEGHELTMDELARIIDDHDDEFDVVIEVYFDVKEIQ